ncbi:MAG: phage tail family protein [Lachnospiraceae bacterium]|nr:phage tail family protein [Lachnospiraceae bacterium]
MYDFIDTTRRAGGATLNLPAEALMINGNYIEHQVNGFRTLSVRGRELMGAEVTDTEIGVSHGSRYQRKRYPSRTIILQYSLSVSDNRAFREAFHQLNVILDIEQAELIFRDEQDKFFIGTKASVGEVDPGINHVIGEIEFFCADPFKYSVQVHDVVPNMDGGRTIAVNYQGDFPAAPIFEADIHSDNGFLGFVDAGQNILQFGNPDEADREQYRRNENLIHVNQRGWQHFQDGSEPFRRNPTWGRNGSFVTRARNGRQWLELANQGSGATNTGGSRWNTAV